METLTIQRKIQSERLYLPEIKKFIGKNVEIIFIIKNKIAPKANRLQNFFELAGEITLNEADLYNLRKVSRI